MHNQCTAHVCVFVHVATLYKRILNDIFKFIFRAMSAAVQYVNEGYLFLHSCAVPSPVLRLRTIPMTTTSVQVRWDEPTKVDGSTTYLKYIVIIRQLGEGILQGSWFLRVREYHANDIGKCTCSIMKLIIAT